MTVAEEILDYTRGLFDVVGHRQWSDTESLLILGLESTPSQNLDEFGHVRGTFRLYGFEKHARLRLELLTSFIRSQGFSAEPVGRFGYPLEGEINLKEEAIRTGLGKRAKSTVVLHPEYGARLRFMAVITNALLDSPADLPLIEAENPVCKGCSVCIDVCPPKILEPYRITDISLCLSNITPKNKEGRSVLCDECLKQCPANMV